MERLELSQLGGGGHGGGGHGDGTFGIGLDVGLDVVDQRLERGSLARRHGEGRELHASIEASLALGRRDGRPAHGARRLLLLGHRHVVVELAGREQRFGHVALGRLDFRFEVGVARSLHLERGPDQVGERRRRGEPIGAVLEAAARRRVGQAVLFVVRFVRPIQRAQPA